MKIPMKRLVGKVYRDKIEVLVLFRVGERYYPNTEPNREMFETYLHTGDEACLAELENEMEVS